jgi:uncharacterized protein (TIGR00369 family)
MPAPVLETTITWGDPKIIYANRDRMGLIELFRAMMRGELPHEPAMAMLGVRLLSVEPGEVVMALDPGPEHCDHHGRVHGGILAAITDTAAGYAIHTKLGLGWTAATLELHQGFVQPVTLESARLTCIGRVTHLGRRTAVAEADITDAKGELCARMGTTMIVRPPQESS